MRRLIGVKDSIRIGVTTGRKRMTRVLVEEVLRRISSVNYFGSVLGLLRLGLLVLCLEERYNVAEMVEVECGMAKA